MMKRAVLVVLVIGTAVGLVTWWMSGPRVAVGDVRHAETLVLGKGSSAGHTYALSIRGSGQIDGHATISLLLDGKPYKVEKLSGAVDFKWGGEWYADTAEVRYEPDGVRSGDVVLRYNFEKLY